MSDIRWTEDQLSAIETRGGSMVVSAAAGSGKTAVLVERVIRMLTDEDDPLSPERLLMVTFTKAAAAEMKRKIKEALRLRAAEDPIAQDALLKIDRATISTMDSFCVRIVRENFESAGVSPDLRVIDENELASMKKRAVSDMLEEYYAADDGTFRELAALFLHKSGDEKLAASVIELADYADSHPDPERWLRETAARYEDLRAPEQTPWGEYLIDDLRRAVRYALQLLQRAADIASGDPDVDAAYGPALHTDLENLRAALRDTETAEGWDAVLAAAGRAKAQTRLSGKRGVGELPAAALVKQLRAKVKKVVSDAFDEMNVSAAVCEQDADRLQPLMAKLTECTLRYNELLTERKHLAGGYYFSDILHLALKMFYDPGEDGLVPTELARRVAASFDAVLIDEYQDTTRAQDALFNAVSDGGKKLFVVGDVKQSIYSFRLATPQIFNDRCEKAFPVGEGRFPARVILGKNFRSRAGILGVVNFIFRQLMTPEAGGIRYDESEYLYFGGGDDKKGDLCDTDVILSQSDRDAVEVDAERMADYILRAVSSGEPIEVRGERRPARFSDFCVLLRSVKEKAGKIAQVFTARNIPVQFESSVDRASLPEVRLFGALLRVVDDPRIDDLLLTVMLFPMFGFTPDDMAALRGMSSGAIADCVKAGAESDDPALAEKCAGFLARLSLWRALSTSMKPSDLVRYLLYETDMAAYISAMPGSTQRLDELGIFLTNAQNYELSGRIGYTGFIRYLDALERAGQQGSVLEIRGEAENVVTIMTVHKSKGLEFPFVLLADTAKRFNLEDLRADVLCDNDLGAAIRISERLALRKYAPIALTAVKTKKRAAAVAEELRLLYVALTRAAYRLAVFGTVRDLEKTAAGAASLLTVGGGPDPYGVLRCADPLTLILAALMRHPDAAALRELAGADDAPLPEQARIRLSVLTDEEREADAAQPAAPPVDRKPFTAEEYDRLRRRIEYVYPYEALRGLPAKITASGFTGKQPGFEDAILARPSFAAPSGVSGAERGTLYHKAMQYLDLEAAAADPEGELGRLVERGVLTREQAALVDMRRISAFLEQEIGRRVRRSSRVCRELEFRLLMPVYELYPDVTGSEQILVQGVADLVFFEPDGAVIVDYKTDVNVSEAELAERYRGQLRIYRKAVEKMFGCKVKQAVLFSLSTGKTVNVGAV